MLQLNQLSVCLAGKTVLHELNLHSGPRGSVEGGKERVGLLLHFRN